MEISHFKVEALSLFFIFTRRYWLRKTTEYNIYTFVESLRSINASILLFRLWIQPMSHSSLQHKLVLPEFCRCCSTAQ
jgi:hypothetical protein